MQDHEEQSSTEARPPLPPGLSPGLGAPDRVILDDPPPPVGCDCSCHRCCVPPDEACEDCPENHPGAAP